MNRFRWLLHRIWHGREHTYCRTCKQCSYCSPPCIDDGPLNQFFFGETND